MPEDKVDIWTLIRRRFPAGEYALLQEVRDAAGFGASRSADGVAMSLWPSRGLGIHGIELKSFRSDWLSEKKKPKKAEAIFQYCDYFWLVANDESVVLQPSIEIPETWGYICRVGNTLKVKKEAPTLKPEPLSKSFVACMLKRATGGLIHPSQIEDRIDIAVEQQKIQWERETLSCSKEYEELKKQVAEFEAASGITLSYRWIGTGEQTGKAVKFLLSGGTEDIKRDLESLKERSSLINDSIIRNLENLHLNKTNHETPSLGFPND